jgi:sugar phosphate isomerase/epimerase
MAPTFGLSTHLFHGERLGRRQLETIKAHGFDAVELFATRTHIDYHDPHALATLAEALQATRVQAVSLHAPICASYIDGVWGRAFSNAAAEPVRRLEAVDETRVALQAAKQLGCDCVVLHLGLPVTQDVPPGDNDRGSVRRSLEALAEASTSAGVPLALEVLPNRLSDPDVLLEYFEELDLVGAGVCLDFGHANLRDGAAEAAETLSGHVVTTHVHDNKGALDNHLVPFEGTIDWARTLTAMWKIGYAGRFIFEVADHGDALGVLARTVNARARLQGILDGLSEPLPFDEAD